MRRRWLAALALVLAAATMTACAALPTSGPVHAGAPQQDTATAPDLIYQPDKPAPGSSPEAIVSGFMAAATSPAGGWEIAQLFLAPSFRDQWKPDAGVTIDDAGSRRVQSSGGSVTVTLSVVADVDETGAYRAPDTGAAAQTPLAYTVAQQADGEWRITSAPNGVVLDASDFANVYHPYALMYFDPSWTYLVPDLRWFPYRAATTSRIVRALVEGKPSPWLAGSVFSAFPSDLTLASETIPLNSDGVAQVDLDTQALDAPSVTLARMQRQLLASLQSASVTGVDLRIGNVPVTTTPAPVASTTIDPRALVAVGDAFGFATGSDVQSLGGGLGAQVAAAAPERVALARGQDQVAMLSKTGQVVRLAGGGQPRVEDARPGLIAPAMDPLGGIWSVPAGSPSAVQLTSPDGTVTRVQGAWPQANAIRAISVARGGARIAAIVETAGGDAVVVAGIQRGSDQSVRLGDVQRLGTLDGTGLDVVWLADQTLGVLSGSGDGETTFTTQPVGGPATAVAGPSGARMLAAGATVATPRVLDGSGVLFTRRATTWQQSLTGVSVLASQLGVGG